ncbi:MAG: CapA family protein [Lachnospiraceae bacterium]|nr:CapA family protein [Lachnospiraceae bacterium]
MLNVSFGKKRTVTFVLAASLALSALTACDVTFVMPKTGTSSPNEEEIKENASDIPAPVISIENDVPPVITAFEEETEEEPVAEYEEIYDPENKVYSVATADPASVTLGFVGDVGFAAGYATINKYRANGSDIHNSIDEGVLGKMQSVDIMMANNEFPYSDRGTPTPNKKFTFRADPKDVHIMKDMGVDIVGLANNHAYDYGPDALIDTIDTLNDAKLPFVGAGKNLDEAMHPAYFHANGHVISIVAATQIERLGSPDTKEATADSPGVLRTLDPKKAVETIREAESNSDFTVMFVHWGTESTDLVEQSQRDLAKAYADAGADLIIGAHPHCLQGIDYVDDVPVFYSLGNFWFNSKTLDTCIVEATLDENCSLKSVAFIPCIQRGSGVASATEAEKARIIEYMRGISNYADIDDDGIVTRSDKDHNTQNGQNTSPARRPAEAEPEDAAEEIPALPAPEQMPDEAAGQPAEALPDWAVNAQ